MSVLPEDVTVDALSGPWRIHQRQKGHKWSIDDLLTAWVAVETRPLAVRHLDLGCGIGSVLMLVAYKLKAARHVGVEAQEQSFGLCRASLTLNGLDGRVEARHGDFRLGTALQQGETFELITGTPPYLPVGTATMPRDSQRAHARLELRGGVEEYCRVGALHLAPGGRLVLCGDGRRPERTHAAAKAAGLHVLAQLDLVPHVDKGPLFHVVTLGWEPVEHVAHSSILARLPDGRRSPEMQRIRSSFDMPPMPGDDGFFDRNVGTAG